MENRNQWLKEISRNKGLWAEELDDIPSMIKLSYTQLQHLAEDGQVYGVMLQCKDVFEALFKVPIIMSLIIIDSDVKYKDGNAYKEVLKAYLSSPMSMGQWNALAAVITKKSRDLPLPEVLTNILKKTRKLYSTEVTPDVPDVINWRNDTIGHGALKFEDDKDYQQEVKSFILMLKEYFDGACKYSIKGMYKCVFFTLNGEKLVGDNIAVPREKSELSLFVDSEKYNVGNYFHKYGLKYYLFDSFYCKKKLTKYSSFEDGQSTLENNNYFVDLYEKHVLKAGKNFNIQSELISREEDMILEYLNTPISYIKPAHLIEQLVETMDELKHGIITVLMERGTGKSAFSNQMSGLYHKVPLIKNSLSRCYHVQNASLKGMNDFINSVNFSFRHSFDPAQDLWGSTDTMPLLVNDTQTPAEDMAEFLNFYHEKYRKEYTIFLIDGIDEIIEQTSKIIDFIPSSNRLEEGVFVILLSRFKEEDTVLGNSKKYIEIAESISQAQIRCKRKDEDNIKVLTECVYQQIKEGKLPTCIDCGELIKRADYRFLFLKAYLGIKTATILDNKNEYSFISSFINYILSFYGISQKHKVKEIAATIALFPSISMRKYQEYMNCMDITYEFVGLLNDLLPVLTVLHDNGEDLYLFADVAYEEFVLQEFPDVVEEVIDFFYSSMKNHLAPYLNNGFLCRIYDPIKTIPEEQLNSSIIFFSEGILGIWNRALVDERIRNIFFSKHNALFLCEKLYLDPWARTGYGYYLREELYNCLGSVLFYCIQNPQDTYSHTWYTRNIRKLIKKRTFDFDASIRYLTHAKDFHKIYNYIMEHPNTVNLEEWFWILENRITKDVISVFEAQEGTIDRFIYNLCINGSTFTRDRLTKIFSKLELKPEQEERILNLQLKAYLSTNELYKNKKYCEQAKKCLDSIRLKGYSIEDTINIDKIEEFINQQEIEYLEEKSSKRIFKKALKYLLDFQSPWKKDPDTISPDFEAYSYHVIPGEYKHSDDVKELHSAFYKRMCFEHHKGNLASFIEDVIYADDIIEEVLKNQFGEGEDYFHELNYWICVIRRIVSKDNKHTYKLLSKMMIEGVKWLLSQKRVDEAEELLEDYIINCDTQAFFVSYFAGRITSAIEPTIIYDNKQLVYCTKNAIYLLNYYLRKGEKQKFETLMTKIEKDIPIIDDNHKANYESQAFCEIAKYKYMKYRKSIDFTSAFDTYLTTMVSNHKTEIEEKLQNLSRNSDFNEIAFHVELLMEYAWQTQQWDLGNKMCNELIDMFYSYDDYADIVVKQSLEYQIKVVKRCKSFFLYFSGEENKCEEKPEQSMNASYHFIRYNTLFDIVQRFENASHQKERNTYLLDDQIILEAYR